MSDLNEARQQRRASADRLLGHLAEQMDSLERLAEELRRGRQMRARARERLEDFGGHEGDTVFGSWLDSDDRISVQLERHLRLARKTADETRAHVAATELLLFELQPDLGDPRLGH
ncbi:MAG: hypothetical protein M3P40_05680 [Actinomycetota bacterium]|nr:hypothetical protein [Actinomycetota bacterium]